VQGEVIFSALRLAVCLSKEAYSSLRDSGALTTLVRSLSGPFPAIGIWSLACVAARSCDRETPTVSADAHSLPSLPNLLPDLLRLRFVAPFVQALQGVFMKLPEQILRYASQLLLMVCTDETGLRFVRDDPNGPALLATLAQSYSPSARHAGIKGLALVSAIPAAQQDLRKLHAAKIFARQFVDLQVMPELDWAGPHAQPSLYWAAKGLFHMASVIDDRSPVRRIPVSVLMDSPNQVLLNDTFRDVAEAGTLHYVLEVAKTIDTSGPLHAAQPFAARACGLLAQTYRSGLEFVQKEALCGLVNALQRCQNLNACMGLLNLAEGIVRDARGLDVTGILLQDGVIGQIVAFLRKELDAPQVITACELLISFLGERAALREADKCDAEGALVPYTFRAGEDGQAARLVVVLLQYLRDPLGWPPAGDSVVQGDEQHVSGVQPSPRERRQGEPGGPSMIGARGSKVIRITAPDSKRWFEQRILANKYALFCWLQG
jgi:hypothetical protein